MNGRSGFEYTQLGAALSDISVLIENLDPNDREKILEGITNAQNNVLAAIEFFYLILDNTNDSPSTDSAFAILAEKGIEAALFHDGVSVNEFR